MEILTACRLFISSIIERLFNKWKSTSIFWARVADKLMMLLWYNNKSASNSSGPIVLPPEVIIEILIRLPFESLIKLQLVCKKWEYTITRDHYFAVKHMDYNAVVRYYSNKYTSPGGIISPDKKKCSYVQGCDGLLLIRKRVANNYFIWNRGTHRVLALPDPHNRSRRFAFAYVPSTANYRIVCLYIDEEEFGFELEVFTPGHSETWRALKLPDIVKANGPTERFWLVCTGAIVHCMLVYEVGNDTSHVMVISLDMGTECFTITPLPIGLFDDWQKVEALDWDGKLAVADVVREDLELMVLEDISNKKHRWCEKKKKIPLPFMKEKGYRERDLLPLFAKRGDIWFWLRGEKIFTYTIETGICTDIKEAKALAHWNNIYSYKRSLVTLEGMQPDTMLEIKWSKSKTSNNYIISCMFDKEIFGCNVLGTQ